MLFSTMLDNNKNKTITRTWLAGQNSCTLVIPKDFAREYGLDSPSHVIVGDQKEYLSKNWSFEEAEK